MQIIFAAERKFLSFALLKHIGNPQVSSVVGIPDWQIVCKANRQQNHTASGIVSYKKVKKARRDQQLDFCSSFCNKGYYLYLVQSHVVVVVHCKFFIFKTLPVSETNEKALQAIL